MLIKEIDLLPFELQYVGWWWKILMTIILNYYIIVN